MDMNAPIIDLHCDLLGCIEANNGKYHFDSPEINCSLPQLKEGNVKLQVLAIAAITQNDSAGIGKRQVKLYEELLHSRKEEVASFKEFALNSPKMHFLFAIENASALLDEHEDLSLGFERLQTYQGIEKILYISLTWNGENRFGGGNLTSIGLKEDGKRLLEFIDQKNIAVDLSHTSDQLAYDLINFIDKRSLQIPIIASHSNYRGVVSVARNLPEEIVKEIVHQQGVIGINFVRRFVGQSPDAFLDHIEYALSIGGENAICLGADFYGKLEIPLRLCPGKAPSPFFKEYSNSSSYPQWIKLLQKQFSEETIENICYRNAFRFIESQIPVKK